MGSQEIMAQKNFRTVDEVYDEYLKGNIKLSQNKNVILLLGNTGSGKSTFSQFIAGDNTKLFSKPRVPGSSEYVITDGSNQIEHGINSITLIPQEVVDEKTNTAYVDLPGFGDTRGTYYDIISNIFIKKIVNSAKGVKLVLIVKYSVMMESRDYFVVLLNHITEFIKDIEKFKNSIVLLVTQIENFVVKVSDQFVIESDEIVLKKITSFIAESQINLKARVELETDNEKIITYKKAICLSEILWSRNQNSNNIAIFRRPLEEGKISDIQLLQQGKDEINRTLQYISFTPININDFRFSLSNESKNSIYKIINNISNEIETTISNIIGEIMECYQLKVSNSEDLYTLQQEIYSLHSSFSKNLHGLQKSVTFKEFFVQFVNFIIDLGIKSSRIVFLNLLKKLNFINFFHLLTNENFQLQTLEWTKSLKSVLDNLDELKRWYTFLVNLCDKFPYYKSYEYFHRIIKLKMPINAFNLLEFLNRLKEFNIAEYAHIQNINLDDVKIRDLNKVMSVILSNDVTFSYSHPGTLIVEGNYIKFSEIIDYLNKNRQTTSVPINRVAIFALISVFIDEDLIEIGKKISILSIAPYWEVIGVRKIVLDGSPGKELAEKKAGIGHDGIPGFPGGNAGSFIGIGRKIDNAENLTITAKGGRGGPGQDGADGLPGTDGVNEDPTGSQLDAVENMKKSIFSVLSSEPIPQISFGVVLGFYGNEQNTKYLIKGAKGTAGGNGFKGGAGGKGGYGGEISLYGLDDAKIIKFSSIGSDGNPGESGKGGRGGKIADDVDSTYVKEDNYWLFWQTSTNTKWINNYRESNKYSPSGQPCIDTSDQGIQMPEDKTEFNNISEDINRYKMLILRKLPGNVIKQQLYNFYLQLDLYTKKINNSLVLLNELSSLDIEYFNSCKKIDWISFYKSLLHKIFEYTQRPNENENTGRHKILLNYLYTATLSKILIISNKHENQLVLNITDYFTLIVKNIKKVQNDFREIVKNEYNINSLKIVSIIKDAKDLTILEINVLISEIEEQIDNLICEITQLQLNSGTRKEILIQKKVHLQMLIKKKDLCENLMLSKSILNCLLNISVKIHTFIQAEKGTTKSFISYIFTIENPTTFFLEESCNEIVTGMNFIHEKLKQRAEVLIHFLDKLLSEINKNPDTFEILINNANNIKTYLLTADQIHLNPSEILFMIEELKQAIQNTIAILEVKTKVSNSSTKMEKNHLLKANMLSSLNELLNLANCYTTVYLKHKDDSTQLKIISDAFQDEEENINSINIFELFVHETILPLFDMMQTDIAKCTNDSPAHLNVSKWNIQDVCNGMNKILQKYSKQCQPHDDLECFANKIEAAMSMVGSVYDLIQNHYDEKELVDCIHEISSMESEKMIDNDMIRKSTTDLALLIKFNTVLNQYTNAMNVFKQFIFPFADYYLEEYDLPIQRETDLKNLITNAKLKLKNLNSKITKNTILLDKNIDQFVHTGLFHKCSIDGSFFVWKTDSYGNIISNLLSGEEVVLKADILRCAHEINAIKFNFIQINFTTNDQLFNGEINAKLNDFEVIMKHYGNSYFRYDNKFYNMCSESQEFNYNFRNNTFGEECPKVQDRQYILSPYATWSFKLKTNSSTNFKKLDGLKGKVDLELVGWGQYVNPKINLCSRDVEKYYRAIHTLSVTDTVAENV